MKIICTWIIIQDKRVLLIKRSKNKNVYPNFWAFPWWRQEESETLEQTTIREIKEEVWLDFEIEKLYNERVSEKWYFHDFIWKASGIVILQVEECDWYWWFNYNETTSLPIAWSVQRIIEKLHDENLID